MESHPIPQQISSYQFRLVGDMTLKQFFQIGGGALVSLLIYATGLHPVIKWPLILFSFGLGAAMAFLPFQERPLSKWIFSFFRSVYSPTIYIWQKPKDPYVFFQPETQVAKETGGVHGEIAVDDYLETRPDEKSNIFSKFEDAEKSFLGSLAGLFSFTPKPALLTEEKKEETMAAPAPSLSTPAQQPMTIPQNKPVEVAQRGFRPKIVVEETTTADITTETPAVQSTAVAPTFTETSSQAQAAQFSNQAAPPLPPYIPNTIVGQVVDADGKIVEGAILEIKDLAGRPVRALRSNKVGHFMIVTALQNGQYDIAIEKEGHEFDPVTFEAKGEIIPPILIKAKKAAN